MTWKGVYTNIILALIKKIVLPENIIAFTWCGLKDINKYISHAIEHEKEIKGWTRAKKIKLIEEDNANWKFLNKDIMEWPPIPENNKL